MDGFKDGGRTLKLGPKGEVFSNPVREILKVMSPGEDRVLANVIANARAEISETRDFLGKIQILSAMVNQLMSKTDDSDNIFPCGKEMSLGDVISTGSGVCRHRSLLFKVLCDRLGIEASLVRGNFRSAYMHEGHAWNEVRDEHGHSMIVDTMRGYIGSMQSQRAQCYRDVTDASIYRYDGDDHVRAIMTDLKVCHIDKGGSNGVEFNVQGLSTAARMGLKDYCESNGLRPILTNSSVQNGDAVIRFFGNDDCSRVSALLRQPTASTLIQPLR